MSALTDPDDLVLRPATEEELEEAIVASAGFQEFQTRMPKQLRDYWVRGEGAARIRWGTPGSFDRCVRQLRDEFPKNTEGLCANLHHEATGKWPGEGRDRSAAITACGDGMMAADMCPPGEHRMPDGSCMPDSQMGMEQGWSGFVAEYGVPTGDSANLKRMFKRGTIEYREPPFALRFQREDVGGHAGAVIVGRVDYVDPDYDEGVYASGVFFPESIVPEVREAKYLLEQKVLGPSVDLDDAAFEVYDSDTGEPVSPNCMEDGSCPVRQTAVPEQARIASVTLVGIPAYATMGHSLSLHPYPSDMEPDMEDEFAILAAVRADWDGLPFAPRSRSWNASEAAARMRRAAEREGGEIDFDRYARGFLVVDGPSDLQGSYKFPIADIIDGRLTIVPRAVFAAAARIGSAAISAEEKERLRGVLGGIYRRMSAYFDDEEIRAPWDTAQAAILASVAGGIFTDVPARPIEAFNLKATEPTPVMITDAGQIWGHIALWDEPHRGFMEHGQMVYAPRSRCDYAEFKLGATRTTAGLLPTGKLVLGGGHADGAFSLQRARRWYDENSAGMAEVNIIEDEFGPFMCGWLLPGVDGHAADEVFRNPPSGDWRPMRGGGHELIAVIGVNVPAFPVARVRVVNGRAFSLVGTGIPWHLYRNEPQVPDDGSLDEFKNIVGDLGDRAAARRAAELSSLLEGMKA